MRLMAFICDEYAPGRHPGVLLLPIFLHGPIMPTSVRCTFYTRRCVFRIMGPLQIVLIVLGAILLAGIAFAAGVIYRKTVSERVLDNVNAYLAGYVVIILISFLLVSADKGNFSIGTNFSAVLACFNNIGPGMEAVGPACNYDGYTVLSKSVLILDMLAGRLEIFPILALFSASTWTKN